VAWAKDLLLKLELVKVESLDVLLPPCNRCSNTDSLQCWLHNHGQQLHKLKLQYAMRLSVLPCPQLQHLLLHSCELDFTAGSSAFPSSISTATALTSLHINMCTVLVDDQAGAVEAAAAQFLSALIPSLTSLQELSVFGVGIYTGRALSKPSAHLLLPATGLQRLLRLTQLHLQVGGEQADGVVQHIGSMTDLQDLRLGGVVGARPRLGQHLSVTQLTALTKLRVLGLRV
jgi:hypothetical protein